MPKGQAQAPACRACRQHPPAFDRTVVLADYAFPWSGVIAALKFQQQPELAPALAQPLSERVRAEWALGLPRPDLLLPVPLSRQRLAERGYNQAWQLTRSLARQLALPACVDALLRAPGGAHQVGASRAQRQANLRAAFSVHPARRGALAGATLALVDDVMTTGATADAAARVLREAGAQSVQIWVAARTPEPG